MSARSFLRKADRERELVARAHVASRYAALT